VVKKYFLNSTRIAILYILFSGISTLINICAQMLSLRIYNGHYSIEISIFIGTIAGLPLRYYLEKRYIFAFKSEDIKHDSKLFVLYSSMGIITTFIFWGTEYLFYILFNTDFMRYTGGVIGLALGYFIKYQLDKRFVFIAKSQKDNLI